jgi:hypothetical protein
LAQARRLPPVYRLVLYRSSRQWWVLASFLDLVEPLPEALVPYVPSFRYALHDLSACANTEIKGKVLTRLVRLAPGVLAYLVHTVLDLVDARYRAVRARLPSGRTFFEHLRALVQYLPFGTWEPRFDCMLDTLGPAPAKAKEESSTGTG